MSNYDLLFTVSLLNILAIKRDHES